MRRIALNTCFLGGIIVLISISFLWCVHVVSDAFDASSPAGWVTLTGVLLVAFGVVYLLGNELCGYLQVRKVDRLAIAMQGLCLRWCRTQSYLSRILNILLCKYASKNSRKPINLFIFYPSQGPQLSISKSKSLIATTPSPLISAAGS